MKYPNVLVISHNCFSNAGSNGRTLGNFFTEYPTENLAQFYIYDEYPDSDVCKNYYRVTDKEALESLYSKKQGKTVEKREGTKENVQHSVARPKKTPFVYLLRELVWEFGFWNNKNLKKWIEKFQPELILFQAGDAAFLFKFALKISRKKSIPLIIYNSESYYFKSKNYLAKSLFSDFWYGILHQYFKRSAKKAISYASCSIYISDMLRAEYDKEFQRPSLTIRTSASLISGDIEGEKERRISYLGNLGVGRYETLIELAKILQTIDNELQIDVYGNASNEVKEALNNEPGINYCGFVSYEECVKIMKTSMLLVHVENFSEFYLSDSKYAFSTKIADSLASGTCLFVFAPRQLSSSKYLIENNAACVVSEKEEARKMLKTLLEDKQLRNEYAKTGLDIAKQNHSLEKNREKFVGILQNVL